VHAATDDIVDLEGEHARKLIRTCLSRCSAKNLTGLAEFLDMDADVLARNLDRMVQKGEVEVLRPIFETDAFSDGGRRPLNADRDVQYYRLVKDTDHDYEWEQEVVVRLPPGRITDVKQEERRAEERHSEWLSIRRFREAFAFHYQ
jgi:hypothetical protein